ncbi:MAG: hypothetical protein ACKO48_04415 [Actinomycetota bacterium]
MSQRLLRAIASDAGIPTTDYSRWWCMASAVLGGVTGWVAMSGASPRDTVLTVLIAVLTVIQAPLDFVTHRLSRYATLMSLGGVLIIWVIEVVGSSRSSALRALVITTVVVTMFAVLHRFSPQSLGWGDVLLVAPLALSVALISVNGVVVWQLLASGSGAVHAIAVRLLAGDRTIPFGPHLLFGAWLVLVASV